MWFVDDGQIDTDPVLVLLSAKFERYLHMVSDPEGKHDEEVDWSGKLNAIETGVKYESSL